MHSEETEPSDDSTNRQADLGEFSTDSAGDESDDDFQELLAHVNQLAENQRTLVTAIEEIRETVETHAGDDPDSDDLEDVSIRGYQ